MVGINQTAYSIQNGNGEIISINKSESIKLILRKMKNMISTESAELNSKGISIGQRKGYSFTPEAFYYLLSLRIDVFNLIEEGLAIEK